MKQQFVFRVVDRNCSVLSIKPLGKTKKSSAISWVTFLFSVTYLCVLCSLAPAKASSVIEFEDTRTRTVAIQVTYKYLTSNEFDTCTLSWLDDENPSDCLDFFEQVHSIAASTKNLQLSSAKDKKLLEAIEMYNAARSVALPHCTKWDEGERPSLCFDLILSAIREKWREFSTITQDDASPANSKE